MQMEVCEEEGLNLFPLRLIIPPGKSRVLYFVTEELKNQWKMKIREAVSFRDIESHYNFGDILG
jgi:hypothetical protein